MDPDASTKPKAREGLRLMPVLSCGERQKWLGPTEQEESVPHLNYSVAVVSWTTGYHAPPSCSGGLSWN